MRIAVTGGTGFIGTATIANGVSRGHDIWPMDQTLGHDILGDLSPLDGAEAVIHLAGVLGTHELFSNLDTAVEVNVRGSTRVMQWCMDNNVLFISIGMMDIFPSIYTATKVSTDRILQALVHAGRIRAANVRAFNAYGPLQHYGPNHPQKIIPTFAVHAWKRNPIPIWGTGDQSVDLVHVDDVGRMLIDAVLLLENGHNGFTLDAGTGVSVSVNKTAKLVAEATNWDYACDNGRLSCAQYLPMRDGEVPSTNVVATGNGWELLDWRPRFDMNLLRETVQWYRDYVA